ncbi:MAG: alkaline phosphatase family protein [Anaerolineales bacterium]|nr:alkaline phosphatase family protein [Anaerolineales bacterium]
MTVLIKKIYKYIIDNPLQLLTHGGKFISPQYEGLSILNIPASAGKLLNVPGFNSPPLQPDLLDPIRGNIKNIIVILVDALGFNRLEEWLEEEKSMIWHSLLDQGVLAPITSISPSTTCAAITSLWTDSSATQHGIMGYEMWLKEYGVTANMIEHKPITYRGGGGNLSLAGFDPETFIPVGSITDHFSAGGVDIHAFQHYSIINSGLSRMFMNDADRHPIGTASDLWISIRELLESNPGTRKYIWAYWGKLDSISHLHGPDSERAKAEFLTFSKTFQDYFLDRLDPGLKKDTLVILTADHGQITTDKENQHFDLSQHPVFTEMLHLLPTGENRLAYLYIKPGRTEAVKEYIQSTWPEQFALIDPEEAVKAGLFGPGDPHPGIYDRLGDLIVAAKGNAFWWWANQENPLIGRHGGLSEDEMLVPFLAARL